MIPSQPCHWLNRKYEKIAKNHQTLRKGFIKKEKQTHSYAHIPWGSKEENGPQRKQTIQGMKVKV